MFAKLVPVMALVCIPTFVQAATDEANFQVTTTRDLVALCATPSTDPLATAAVNFCHGYAVGAYQYDRMAEAAEAASGTKPLFCPPSPPPSRNDTIAQFVAWANGHPQYLDQSPINGIFEFLKERFPCRS